MFKKTRIVKRFVRRNKAKFFMTTTAVLGTVVFLQNRGIKSHNEFLDEKGLLDEYYRPE